MATYPYHQAYLQIVRGFCHDWEERLEELVDANAPDDTVCWNYDERRPVGLEEFRAIEPEIAARVEQLVDEPIRLVVSR